MDYLYFDTHCITLLQQKIVKVPIAVDVELSFRHYHYTHYATTYVIVCTCKRA